MQKTVISEYIEKSVQSFFVNAAVSSENAQKLAVVQQAISQAFPDVIWSAPVPALHITLVDLLSARVDYDAYKLQLFQEHVSEYDAALAEVLKGESIIDVTFSELTVMPNAIIAIGKDDGSFARIRNTFRKRVSLLPGTKPAPQIIHSTICRYKQEADLQPIQEFVSKQRIAFTEHIKGFRLVHEIVWPLVQFDVAKEYPLDA